MNISYNWLKDYIEINDSHEELAEQLTQLGLETANIEEINSVKGGLKGFTLGKVMSCVKHPNADKLSQTTVDIGKSELLKIVCGAPNVAAGQKVVVATVGTIIYKGNESFEIKKAKIRGEESEGMICAEDEMNLGTSHAGIMVLPDDALVGMKASDYFKLENDYVLEIDLTPNRIDAASHIGVARDLAAFKNMNYRLPDISAFKTKKKSYTIKVEVPDPQACQRYSGICMDNIRVGESPEWLKNKLKSIGLNPINNIVDITNFVLHETGHPLHAFDGDKIIGNKIVVRTVEEGTNFITLDGIQRKLTSNDLMICNEKNPMCIAGVFGGIESGISEGTNKIFIESACFSPAWVRKTAKYHGISTDSSFRFERGADINMTIFAVKRAAMLIESIGAGEISSEIVDFYPVKAEPVVVEYNYKRAGNLIGKNIPEAETDRILKSLEIDILSKKGSDLLLRIPSYRVDVYREADVVEDVLRIYGYNNVEIPEKISVSINNTTKLDNEKLVNTVSDLLVSHGFYEIMCNSLISNRFFSENEQTELVRLFNPLSNDLSTMRPSPVYGGLDSIAYNINRKNSDLKFFEFGKTYHADKENNNISDINRYSESKFLALWITGKRNQLHWNLKDNPTDFYLLKSYVEMLLNRIGISVKSYQTDIISDKDFSFAMVFKNKNDVLCKSGLLNKKITEKFDIDQEVFYVEINWDMIYKTVKVIELDYKPISKFPKVKRDLAILIDSHITYKTLTEIAYKTEPKYISEINLFDVYSGKNLENGKISYALSFILEDTEKTMTDKQIDGIMRNLINAYQKQISAQIR
ncbi:MAG TPA: phenylalanine--tRNA ligase subunit beta [Bacteroidales bacterium]|nr:phenylalanine--tRNA ligase subunit beta [Bacteroidales bacterium]